MRRISRSGLVDVCCGAGCGGQPGARAAFEIKRKHIQAKAIVAGLLNSRRWAHKKARGAIPLCIRHCRFLPEKLIERPIANLFITRFALMSPPKDEAGFVIFDVAEIHHFPAATPGQADLFGGLTV